MDLSSSSRRTVIRLGVALVVLSLGATVLAQPGVQSPPLYREPSASETNVNGRAVDPFLGTNGFIAADDNVTFRMTYRCISGYDA
ncbi:MAG: hypothetical protein KY455_09675, partial [Euryarchaeota archaeon]|nr:hypothetical protein [Euryarchaeota archaeon]